MSINKILIDGRIGKDADVRYTASGSCIVKFSIASTERKKDGDSWVDGDTSWFDVEYWPKDDSITDKFKKGAYLRLKGRLKEDKWTDKEGNKRTKVKIVMQSVESWEYVKGGSSAPVEKMNPPIHREPVKTVARDFDPQAYEDDIPF